jgi:hypothetical protein
LDFLKNLEGQQVYQHTVYVERVVSYLNGSGMRDASSFEVCLRISAILQYKDGGQALLEAAETCGVDRLTENTLEGSTQFDELLRQLHQACTEAGLQVRPGTLDL